MRNVCIKPDGGENMTTRKPRPIRSRGRTRSVVENDEVWVQVPVPDRFKDWPKEYRRVAAWLRKAADWFEAKEVGK